MRAYEVQATDTDYEGLVDVEGVMGVGSRAMFDRMLDAVETGDVCPVIDRVFDFDDAREAYRYVDAGEHQGKVVVSVE